ncbi:hypothetical protein YQE_03083, partial [Dendroctonus ponderosae]
MSNKLIWVDEDDMEKSQRQRNLDEENDFVERSMEEGGKSIMFRIPAELEEDRGGWGNKLDFLMSCISLSVGLGNVWRFPYLCYKNGGGAFLVTYSIAMVVCGIPIFFQEVAIGQYLGSGGMTFVGQLCPILKGVGFATMTIVFLLDVYYCVIIAWTLYYIISTVAYLPVLPWQGCDNLWNTKDCFTSGSNLSFVNGTKKFSPVEEYFEDAVITCVVNTFTSVLAGVVTFSILGHLAHEQNVNVGDVVKSGPGLVFLTYPEVVLKLPGAPFWAIIFFIMLLILGIDSAFCLVESFITGLMDNWSTVLRPHRQKFTATVCIIMFLLGIPMVTHGGMYVFQLMDYYSASGMSLLWVCFFQTVAISWTFGVDKLCDCIEQMMGTRPNMFWRICWKYCAPIVIAVIFVQQCMEYQTLRYGEYNYPLWANIFGLGISFSSMLWVPVYAIYYLLTQPNSIIQNFKDGLIPAIKQRKISICDKTTGQLITQSKVGLITPSVSLVQNEKLNS